MMFGARSSRSSASYSAWPMIMGSANTDPVSPAATIAFNLPSGYEAGELLVLIVRYDGYQPSTPAGWTSVLSSYNSYGGFIVFAKVAAGSEGSTVNVSAPAAEADHGGIALRISGADTINGTTGISFSSNPDMVSHTPVHSEKKYLYLCVLSAFGNNISMGTPPTNYTAGAVSYPVDMDANEASVRYCYRNNLETAEDPGIWALSGSYPAYATIAIYEV